MRLLISCLAIVLLTTPVQAQITNYQAPGNLAPTRDPGCIKTGQAGNDLTPADLAMGVLACVDKGHYVKAASLTVLMNLRAYFDAKRVTDKSAHQAAAVLMMNLFGALSERERSALDSALSALGGDEGAWHMSFCSEQKSRPAPDYYPAYMIQHGMGAVLRPNEPALLDTFDADGTWDEVLRTYLKCI